MISIYDYFDYRKYLQDIYQERKSANSLFSYRYIGGKVGFSSAGFFTKILQGKTNISMKSAIAFARLFKMTKQETHYFEVLVQFNQAVTHEAKKYFFEQLISMKQTGGKNLVPEQYELFSTWYYVVIRDLLNFYPFYGDFKELASMVIPAIKESEAKKAIAVLEKLGLITKNPDGCYEQTDAVISTGEAWKSVAIEQFQIAMADLAGRTIRTTPKEQRDISTCTLSISSKSLEAISERAKQFRKEVLEIARADNFADRIYHLNIHLFPVSQSHRGDRQ
ncbi:MAG: TIGR02147 family protein [Chitinispirillaceae bacterium]|nr:TIGR02147 family protein [Chitinispirillaceae bacterium]